MKIEDRTGVFGAGTQIICVCETEGESKLVDLLGKPNSQVEGELRLSDGHGVFYIILRPKPEQGAEQTISCEEKCESCSTNRMIAQIEKADFQCVNGKLKTFRGFIALKKRIRDYAKEIERLRAVIREIKEQAVKCLTGK